MPCIHRGDQLEGGYVCHSDHITKALGYMPADLCEEGVCVFYGIPNGESAGLGDTLHRFTHATGIDTLFHDCGGCGKRKAFLNKLAPYQRGET